MITSLSTTQNHAVLATVFDTRKFVCRFLRLLDTSLLYMDASVIHGLAEFNARMTSLSNGSFSTPEALSEALESADKLYPANSLLPASLRLLRASHLVVQSVQSIKSDEKDEKAFEAWRLLEAASSTLLRRFEARTVLPDACTPGEAALERHLNGGGGALFGEVTFGFDTLVSLTHTTRRRRERYVCGYRSLLSGGEVELDAPVSQPLFPSSADPW